MGTNVSERLKTIPQFLESRPGFTIGQIRMWIHREEKYGLRSSGAVRKLGKRVYIDPENFDKWLSRPKWRTR